MGQCECEWFHLAQDGDKEAISCDHGNDPAGSINCGEFLD